MDSLDLTNNLALSHLFLDGCNFSSLDLSNNQALEVLDVENNSFVNLDVSANVNLRKLFCFNNPLESLDVSNNLRLKELYCQRIPIDTLDVSKNDSLEILACGNSLTGLILPDTSALIGLYPWENFLESIDVSGCPYLEEFVCYNNAITSLDLTNNPLLNYLECQQNQLTSLDVSNNLELNILWCGENLLTSLDLSNNNKIGSFPSQWDHLNVELMPSLGEVCVWDSFPGDATINYDGSPNVCFDSIACDGVCTWVPGIEGFDHSELMIYPNPTSDILTIETSTFRPHSIELFSVNGQETYDATYFGNLHHVDLSTCSKGIYFLHIRSDNHTITRKIVKL